jgi:hypothetical protein
MDTLLSDFFSLKSFWTDIAQFGVKPFAIVIHFKLFGHLIFGIRSALKPFTMNRFDFKAVVPAFYCRLIIRIAFLAHAANQWVFMEKFLIGS